MGAGLRPICAAATLESAGQALAAFAASTVGTRSPSVVDVWRPAWPEFIPFLDLPPKIRRVVCTTNAVECMNYQLRKVKKTRGHFPDDESADKLLYLGICDIENRTTSRGGTAKNPSITQQRRGTQGWKDLLNHLAIIEVY